MRGGAEGDGGGEVGGGGERQGNLKGRHVAKPLPSPRAERTRLSHCKRHG